MQAREYRSDIDVLRAIAVLAVIFYHAHVPFFSGGYVGVSIFFVISGYLITGIIKRKLENGTFSFLEFYENRVRRIFPALFVTVFCLVLFEWFTSINIVEKANLYSSAKRVLLTVPNFYFYLHTNYFDPAAESMPLLHTWSLGVEEQFYFIFPLLLFLSYIYIYKKNNSKTVLLLSVLWIGSFLFSAVFVFYNQKFTFYMLPARAWELLCGALLAYTEWTPKVQKYKILCFFSGILLMFSAIIGYSDNIYPGLYAALPCFGAVLYIAGGTHLQYSLADVFIKNKVLVFIGVISYSLYLWHWPILVYYQNWLYQREIDFASGSLLLTVIFLVSAFSWRFIEKPIRQKPIFKRHTVLWTSVLCSFGVIVLFINQIIPTPVIHGVEYTYTIKSPTYYFEYCAENSQHSVLVVGDSHASRLVPLIDLLAQKHHFSYVYTHMKPYRTYNLRNDIRERNDKEKYCRDFVKCIETKQFDTAVIAYWYDYQAIGGDVRKNTLYNPLRSFDNDLEDSYEVLHAALKETIILLKEHGVKNIYCVGSVPFPIGIVPLSANKLSGLFHFNNEKINAILGESVQTYETRTAKTKEVLDSLRQEFPDMQYIAPQPCFLNAQKTGYDVVKGTTSLYSDSNHLSTEGVLLLESLFESVFASLLK